VVFLCNKVQNLRDSYDFYSLLSCAILSGKRNVGQVFAHRTGHPLLIGAAAGTGHSIPYPAILGALSSRSARGRFFVATPGAGTKDRLRMPTIVVAREDIITDDDHPIALTALPEDEAIQPSKTSAACFLRLSMLPATLCGHERAPDHADRR